MSPPRTKLKASPSMEEDTDASHILTPKDVNTNTDLRTYYLQRMGPDFDAVTFIQMNRETYLSLIHGEQALLSKMIVEDEEAANEIFVSFAGDKLNRVVMTLAIESPTTGNRAVEYIRAHKSTATHEMWLAEMVQLSFKMQQVHRQWKRQPFPYCKVPPDPRLKPSGERAVSAASPALDS